MISFVLSRYKWFPWRTSSPPDIRGHEDRSVSTCTNPVPEFAQARSLEWILLVIDLWYIQPISRRDRVPLTWSFSSWQSQVDILDLATLSLPWSRWYTHPPPCQHHYKCSQCSQSCFTANRPKSTRPLTSAGFCIQKAKTVFQLFECDVLICC